MAGIDESTVIISDRVTGRIERFVAEGYEVPDVVVAVVQVLTDLVKNELVDELRYYECRRDLLLMLKEDRDAFLGDVIHGLALSLADFTCQLRSDVDSDDDDSIDADDE